MPLDPVLQGSVCRLAIEFSPHVNSWPWQSPFQWLEFGVNSEFLDAVICRELICGAQIAPNRPEICPFTPVPTLLSMHIILD
jgi:hypothetical protein